MGNQHPIAKLVCGPQDYSVPIAKIVTARSAELMSGPRQRPFRVRQRARSRSGPQPIYPYMFDLSSGCLLGFLEFRSDGVSAAGGERLRPPTMDDLALFIAPVPDTVDTEVRSPISLHFSDLPPLSHSILDSYPVG